MLLPVVVAGGTWSNLFLGNMGLDLPSLGRRQPRAAHGPGRGWARPAVWTDDYAIRKRDDGGYTISRGSGNTVEIVPNSFRYAFDTCAR